MTRLAAFACLLVACGTDEPSERPTIFGTDARPAELQVPAALTPGKQYPLVMVLHGFGANGFGQAAYLGVGRLADTDEALVIAPDGTQNSGGMQFWNADPACCDFDGQNPDDVAYLGDMLDAIIATWPVDKNAVYVIGHSNGGFMSFRMACERADIIAGIMSLAGLATSTPASCTPERPVNVLQVHGTADMTVPYQGGTSMSGLITGIGAEASVAQWAGHNGCSGTQRMAGAELDLDNAIDGIETHASSTSGCPEGGAADLWAMEGSGHIPGLTSNFKPSLMTWLLAHARSAH